jgi:hypothetical protein
MILETEMQSISFPRSTNHHQPQATPRLRKHAEPALAGGCGGLASSDAVRCRAAATADRMLRWTAVAVGTVRVVVGLSRGASWVQDS